LGLKPRSCGLSMGLDSPGNEGCCHPRPSYRAAMVTTNDVVHCVIAVRRSRHPCHARNTARVPLARGISCTRERWQHGPVLGGWQPGQARTLAPRPLVVGVLSCLDCSEMVVCWYGWQSRVVGKLGGCGCYRPGRRAGLSSARAAVAGDVAEAPAPEVANRVPALCNLVVDAETPEAAPDQALFKKLPGIHGVSRGSVLRCSPSLAGAILL
jgi:hypothetical protein